MAIEIFIKFSELNPSTILSVVNFIHLKNLLIACVVTCSKYYWNRDVLLFFFLIFKRPTLMLVGIAVDVEVLYNDR